MKQDYRVTAMLGTALAEAGTHASPIRRTTRDRAIADAGGLKTRQTETR